MDHPHKELMSQMLALWNGEIDDVTVADTIYARDFVGNGRPIGVDAVKSLLLSSRRAFPTQHYDVSDELIAGDHIALRLVWTGRHEGEWQSPVGSLPATERRFSVGGVEIFELGDGKITAAWAYYDMLSLLKQLGISLHPS